MNTEDVVVTVEDIKKVVVDMIETGELEFNIELSKNYLAVSKPQLVANLRINHIKGDGYKKEIYTKRDKITI